jgi:hypothetical protein
VVGHQHRSGPPVGRENVFDQNRKTEISVFEYAPLDATQKDEFLAWQPCKKLSSSANRARRAAPFVPRLRAFKVPR